MTPTVGPFHLTDEIVAELKSQITQIDALVDVLIGKYSTRPNAAEVDVYATDIRSRLEQLEESLELSMLESRVWRYAIAEEQAIAEREAQEEELRRMGPVQIKGQ